MKMDKNTKSVKSIRIFTSATAMRLIDLAVIMTKLLANGRTLRELLMSAHDASKPHN